MDGDELDAYLDRQLKRARIEVLKEAAKAVCLRCRREVKTVVWKDRYNHMGRDGLVWCDANEILKLIAAAQKDEEDEEI